MTTWEIKISVTILGGCETESLVDIEEDDAVAGEAESETEVARKAKTRTIVRMTKMVGRARKAETLENAQEAEREMRRMARRIKVAREAKKMMARGAVTKTMRTTATLPLFCPRVLAARARV